MNGTNGKPKRVINWVCVFCGSRSGKHPAYAESAQEVGRALARRGWGLVYGGGRVGMMGAVATTTLEAGGEVVGVIPHSLAEKEIAQTDVTELIVVDTMHQRKEIMSDRADAFIALPGGYGTCDELFEILTWAQLGIHRKPVGLLNVNGFFDTLLAWLDHMQAEDFLRPVYRQLLIVEDNVDRLMDRLEAYRPDRSLPKWVAATER